MDPTIIQGIIIQVVLITIPATLTQAVLIIIQEITIQAVQTTIQVNTILEDQAITNLDFVPVSGTQDPNPVDRIITITNPVTTMDNALDKWNAVMEQTEWGLANNQSFMVEVIHCFTWFYE